MALVSSVLFMVCGGFTAALIPLAPGHPESYPPGAFAVAASAFVTGIIIAALPWSRWPMWTTQTLIPVALFHIAAFNLFAAEPYLYVVYFMVVAVWIGVTQRPGLAVWYSPLTLAAYLAPVPLAHDAANALWSAPIIVAISVALSEVTSRLMVRLARTEGDLHSAHRRYQLLIREASEAVVIVSPSGLIEFVSPAATKLLGLEDESALLGSVLAEWVHVDDGPAVDGVLRAGSIVAGASRKVGLRFLAADGSTRFLEGLVTNLTDQPEVAGYVFNLHDVTDRHFANELVAEIAFRDSLTGLPNRSGLLRAVEQRVKQDGAQVAVLLLDLDGFKAVNDSLGHAAGDLLLAEVSSRLSTGIGTGHLVARLGGDEFVVLVDGDDTDARVVAQRVVDLLERPFTLGERRLRVTASVGVATAGPGDDMSLLLQHADFAMYQAKAAGKSRIAVFAESLAIEARMRHELAEQIIPGLDRGEFFLVYQPIVNVPTGRVVGVEALLRWNHPELGLVPPDRFIPIAEETGSIVALGGWVLEEAARQAVAWDRMMGGNGPRMRVNVSLYQVTEDDLAVRVRSVLHRSGIEPSKLSLEITESVLADRDQVVPILNSLRRLGVRISVDDFGTGYSSLAYLRDLPIDCVKIDRSFLSEISPQHPHSPLVEAIVKMAHTLGLGVIAEGVETELQRDELVRIGCDRIQGFLYSRPESVEAIDLMLLSESSLEAREDLVRAV